MRDHRKASEQTEQAPIINALIINASISSAAIVRTLVSIMRIISVRAMGRRSWHAWLGSSATARSASSPLVKARSTRAFTLTARSGLAFRRVEYLVNVFA